MKWIVVPCYNEASRLDTRAFAPLADDPLIHVLFVDDGSADSTRQVLKRTCKTFPPGKAEVLCLPTNQGKGEAVRQGMLFALLRGAVHVGFIDADLATPVPEVLRLLKTLETAPYQIVMGSRVQMLGTQIERRALRHYLGRCFSTFASLTLHLRVYDTQCGAKFFKAHPAVLRALSTPFFSRWIFDLELIARLLDSNATARLRVDDFLEVPLREWRDRRGSKLSSMGMVRAGWDLLRLFLQLHRLQIPLLASRKTLS